MESEKVGAGAGEASSSAVGDLISAGNSRWSFDGSVSDTFDDHVSKSVPLYGTGHDLVAKVSDFFLQAGSVCYDLGCSTGTLTMNLAERNADRDVRVIGIDPVSSMVERARSRTGDLVNLEYIEADVLDVDLEPADLIVSYYTQQFVKPKHRQTLVNKVYEALNWGGAFLLFEKVRAPDARFQDMMSAIYVDYKIDRGYNADEIVGKARSLKGVLEPFSTQGNIDLLERAGFVDVMTIMKYVCFEGFLAIK